MDQGLYIVAEHTPAHRKGPGRVMEIPFSDPVIPDGVILGQDTALFVMYRDDEGQERFIKNLTINS